LVGGTAGGEPLRRQEELFWTFYRSTRDLLFLLFAIAFWVECLNLAALALADSPTAGRPIFFLGRLLAYLLIIAAIVQKNFSKRG
jgi:hypothetical protein